MFRAQSTNTRVDSPITAHAAALLVFAAHDEVFAQYLERLFLPSLNNDEAERFSFSEELEMLVPKNPWAARQQAKWVASQVKTGSHPQADKLIQSWIAKRPYEDPKSIVVGIVGLAIPGPTLGLIEDDPKSLCVIRLDAAEDKNVFAESAGQASLGLISRALYSADGEARNMEPVFGHWFFGSQSIDFCATDFSLEKIREAFIDNGILHSSVEHSGEVVCLMITPAADISYQKKRWQLQSLKK